MTRRDFLCLLTALVLVPHAGLAQKRRLIATLALGPRASVGVLFDAFQQARRDLGYRDDNTVIEGRWADGDVERLPGLAAELVRLSPDVIVALSGIATPAL